jgi:hypothetical protein
MPPRVSRCLSAAGVRFLGILFPPGSSALLTVGLPGSAWTLAGFPRSAHPSHGRIGRPLYPEAQRCSHGRSRSLRPPLAPSPRGQALSPRRTFHLPELSITRRHQGFTHVRPPGLPPRLLALDGTAPLGLALRASHPARQDLSAHAGAGDGHQALARSYTPGILTGPPSRKLTRNVRPRVARSAWT